MRNGKDQSQFTARMPLRIRYSSGLFVTSTTDGITIPFTALEMVELKNRLFEYPDFSHLPERSESDESSPVIFLWDILVLRKRGFEEIPVDLNDREILLATVLGAMGDRTSTRKMIIRCRDCPLGYEGLLLQEG